MASVIAAARGSRPARIAGIAVLVVAALAAGVGVGAIGDRLGPSLVLIGSLGAMALALVLSRPALGLAAVFASVPAGFVTLPTDALGLQLAEMAVLFVIGVVVLRRLGAGTVPLPWSPPMWWAFLLVAWTIIATPGALDLPVAFKQTALVVGGFLLALAVLGSVRSFHDVRINLAVLLVIGTGVGVYGGRELSSVETVFGGSLVTGRAESVFTHPNELGAFIAVVLMLALGWTLGARSGPSRLAGAIAAIASFVGLLSSFSRGAWLGTALALLVLLVLVPHARRAVLVIGIPAMLVSMGLILTVDLPDSPQVIAVRERLTTILDPSKRNPYDDRMSIYEEALRQMGQKPLTGHGPGNFPIVSARSGSLVQTVAPVHAHNVPLTVGAEIGIPGMAFLLGFTIALGLTAWRSVRRIPDARDRAIAAGITAALVAQLGHGIVDFTMRNAALSILLWSLVGLLLVVRRESLRREHPDTAASTGTPTRGQDGP